MTSDNMTYVDMSPVDILLFDQYEHFSVVRALVPPPPPNNFKRLKFYG